MSELCQVLSHRNGLVRDFAIELKWISANLHWGPNGKLAPIWNKLPRKIKSTQRKLTAAFNIPILEPACHVHVHLAFNYVLITNTISVEIVNCASLKDLHLPIPYFVLRVQTNKYNN